MIPRELQRAYYSIMEIQRLQDDLQQFCNSTENRALKIREYKNELYEMLQNKLKVCNNKSISVTMATHSLGGDSYCSTN